MLCLNFSVQNHDNNSSSKSLLLQVKVVSYSVALLECNIYLIHRFPNRERDGVRFRFRPFSHFLYFLPEIRNSQGSSLLPTVSTVAQAKNRSYCSVPGCFSYAAKNPYLHFHNFPTNGKVRQKWVQAIRREEGPVFVIKKGCALVCSQHFTPDDYTLG